VTESTPSFFARLSLAVGTFFRLLGDAAFAQRLTTQALMPKHAEPAALDESPARQSAAPTEAVPRDLSAAMQLLALLQREGRLIDFLQQDMVGFGDADVGAAARIVHQGCRRALEQAVTLEPIRTEAEGTSLTLDAGFEPKSYRLVGNVQGKPPYRGTLRHRGWRLTNINLEEPLAAADLSIIAPAEVEL
jgi:hypothetical protein